MTEVTQLRPRSAGASVPGQYLPTRADLDRATAATIAVINDPASSAADRAAAAAAEEAVLLGYALRPGAEAELEAGI
jgi:hypothetical protein